MINPGLIKIKNKLDGLRECTFFHSQKEISYAGMENRHKKELIPTEDYFIIVVKCDGEWHTWIDENGNSHAYLCSTTEMARLKFLIKKITGDLENE
jgi:hypothetical protein